MLKGYKYNLLPNAKQRVLIEKHIGCMRLVHNLALEVKQKAYKLNKTNLSHFDLNNQLVGLKKDFDFLKEINSQSLQMSVKNMDNAYQNFFKGHAKYPRYKSKKDSRRQSFNIPQHITVDFEEGKIYIPKFKEGIRVNFHREFKGTIKNATIRRMPSGKYQLSITVDTNDKPIAPPKPTPERAIGIDLNLKNFATYGTLDDSIKAVIDNPTFLKKDLEKVQKLSRQLSRKEKKSNRREKAKLKLARAHETIKNKREDFLHKLSYILTHDNQVDTICMEDLNVRGMVRNGNLARAISDVGWGKFRELVKYKCEIYGKNFLLCDRFAPTSKQCGCGSKNEDLTLDDREWLCTDCGVINERDVLAYRNIIHFAFKKLEQEQIQEQSKEQSRVGTTRIHASGEGVRRRVKPSQSSLKQEATQL